MRELAPDLATLFDRSRTSYTVAQTDSLLGELKRGRDYRSREVFLGADVFVADFPEALAVFLHEHTHIFGYDGDRGFTDALTELIETVVRHRNAMNQYEAEWDTIRTQVAKERRGKKAAPVDAEAEWLASKSESELRALLGQVPAVVLRRLKKRETEPEQPID